MDEQLNRVLSTLTEGGSGVDPAEAEALGKRYPFFYLPALLALKGGVADAGTRRRLMEQIALNAPDPAGAFVLADVAYEEWADFYPTVRKGEVSTNDAISKFLETYGHSDPREEALLERLIFNPTPDYSSLLAREEEADRPTEADAASENEQDALINSFILKHKDDESQLLPREHDAAGESEPASAVEERRAAAVEHHAPSPAARPAYDSSLSESLAKIYIKTRRYERAYEILSRLSLSFPEKNAYFADQLRFLRKLMLAESIRKKRNGNQNAVE